MTPDLRWQTVREGLHEASYAPVERALAALDSLEREMGEALAEAELKRIETHHANAKRRDAEAEVERLREALERALFLADHLWQMIPQSVWRDSGGDDMQGHYEGDYQAERVREELAQLRAALGGGE